jgi:hypothetical protein
VKDHNFKSNKDHSLLILLKDSNHYQIFLIKKIVLETSKVLGKYYNSLEDPMALIVWLKVELKHQPE